MGMMGKLFNVLDTRAACKKFYEMMGGRDASIKMLDTIKKDMLDKLKEKGQVSKSLIINGQTPEQKEAEENQKKNKEQQELDER